MKSNDPEELARQIKFMTDGYDKEKNSLILELANLLEKSNPIILAKLTKVDKRSVKLRNELESAYKMETQLVKQLITPEVSTVLSNLSKLSPDLVGAVGPGGSWAEMEIYNWLAQKGIVAGLKS